MTNDAVRVLISSVGRRGYLVDYFRSAVGAQGRVFASDADRFAPGLARADVGFVVPRADDSEYVPAMLDLCQRHGVDLVVPINDHELPVLARARGAFEAAGIRVLVAQSDVVDKCLDKWATHQLLEGAGFEVPRTYERVADVRAALRTGRTGFPLVVKPRLGSGSNGLTRVNSAAELAAVEAPHVLVQETLIGQESGLDVVCDLEGRYLGTLVREKLATRFGETAVARTSDDPEMTQLGQRLAATLAHVGMADVDVFRTTDGRVVVVDVNPRFGGGYPMSHAAGADAVSVLVAALRGRPWDPGWLQVPPGVTVSKTVDVQVLRCR